MSLSDLIAKDLSNPINGEIKKEAERWGFPARDFACTVVLLDWRVFRGFFSDRRWSIVIAESRGYSHIFWPQMGEYAI